MTLRIPKALLLFVALLLVGGGIGVGGYYLGRESVDKKAIRAVAFKEGERAGAARARKSSNVAEEQTADAAANAVLGGLGEPKAGRFYIVSFVKTKGTLFVPYSIGENLPLQAGTLYSLCADGKSICEQPG